MRRQRCLMNGGVRCPAFLYWLFFNLASSGVDTVHCFSPWRHTPVGMANFALWVSNSGSMTARHWYLSWCRKNFRKEEKKSFRKFQGRKQGLHCFDSRLIMSLLNLVPTPHLEPNFDSRQGYVEETLLQAREGPWRPPWCMTAVCMTRMRTCNTCNPCNTRGWRKI